MIDFAFRSTFAAGPSATTSPPCRPAPGPMSTSQSERAHHLLVVLDDDHGVAEVAQPLERRDQPVVVALVEPDRRLVEDVEDADELRADLGREPQPLRLAARERRRRAVERQVADADVVEERQPLADLLHDPVADQLLGRASARARRRSRSAARHRQLRELVDRSAADGDREHLGLQPRALADRARPEATCTPRSAPAAATSRSRGSGARGSRRCPRRRACTARRRPIRLRYWT